MITFLLLVAAFFCFAFAAAGVPTGRLALGWLGAALVTVTLLVGAYPGP